MIANVVSSLKARKLKKIFCKVYLHESRYIICFGDGPDLFKKSLD